LCFRGRSAWADRGERSYEIVSAKATCRQSCAARIGAALGEQSQFRKAIAGGNVVRDTQLWSIRAATLDDAERLATLGTAAYAETYPGMVRDSDMAAWTASEHSAAKYRQFLEGSGRIWLAIDTSSGESVGYAFVDRPALIGIVCAPTDYELRRLYIRGPLQRRGIGADLLQTAIQACRDWGYRRLLAQILAANTSAQKFYWRLGAAKIGTAAVLTRKHFY
jgi:GNAT superfamily N-acetyltransferase